MLNKIIVCGRMTADPEMRSTPQGKNVTSFTLAVDRDFKKNGERETDFLNCVAWNNTADFVARYFRKGSMAIVSGRLQTRGYEVDGHKRTATEIITENVYFGEGKKDKEETAEHLPTDFSVPEGESDDLPF